jgi:hypothetical protein
LIAKGNVTSARVQPNDCSKGMMRTPGVERMPAETNNVKKVIPLQSSKYAAMSM